MRCFFMVYRHYFNLNEVTGLFSRRVTIGPREIHKAGKPVGTIGGTGYIRVPIAGKLYLAHHLVWLWFHGKFPADQIDHINHNRQDNRISNLRDVSQQENGRNTSRSSKNRSGKTGVWLDKRTGKWCAEIFFNGNKHLLGSFINFNEACLRREQAKKEFGFHENHGL